MLSMLRDAMVTQITGEPTSTRYEKMSQGLFVPGVKIGPKSVAWPSDEVEAINRARIAGATDEEIRNLVKRLVAARSRHREVLASIAA